MKKRLTLLFTSLFLVLGLCSCSSNNENQTPKPEEHTHQKESKWDYDKANHWHNCTGCDEKLDLAAHTFTDWEIVKEATCTEEGSKTRKCSICHYTETRKIDKLTHTPEENWDYDEQKHWHNCTGGCDAHLDEAMHEFGEWVVISEASCKQTGLKERTCKVCNYKEHVELPLAPHIIGKAKYNEVPDFSKEKVEITVTCLNTALHSETIAVPILPMSQWEKSSTNTPSCLDDVTISYVPKDDTVIKWLNMLSHEFRSEQNKQILLSKKEEYFKFDVLEKAPGHLIDETSLIYEKFPTYSENGILKVKCLREGCNHVDTILLPVLSDYDYNIQETGNCLDGIEVTAVLANQERVSLFDGTMLEGKTDLINSVMTHEMKFTLNYESHNHLSATLIKAPTFTTPGEYEIKCSRCGLTYKYELPIPNFVDYILEPDPGDTNKRIYKLNDEYPYTVRWGLDFDNKAFEDSKADIVKSLKFSLEPIEIEWSVESLRDKKDPVKVNCFDKVSKESLGYVSLPSINTPNAYTISYVTENCGKVLKAYTLTKRGLNSISGILHMPTDYINNFKQDLLKAPLVHTICDTAEEEALNKDPNKTHNFEITSFDTGKTDGRGYLIIRCKNCDQRFRYDFQTTDIFDDIDGSYVFNSSNLIALISKQTKKFIQKELDAIERLILDYEAQFPDEFII